MRVPEVADFEPNICVERFEALMAEQVFTLPKKRRRDITLRLPIFGHVAADETLEVMVADKKCVKVRFLRARKIQSKL